MNALEIFIQSRSHDECAIMDLLQGDGIVSDNAVMAKDVCEGDAVKAVEFLVRK